MSLNGGLGAVIQKNIQLNTYQASDGLGAVKHGNGRDWWIITKDYDSNIAQDSLHVYLVSPMGIQESIQQTGVAFEGGLDDMTFSKDGSKFLLTAYNSVIETMDFDRCTGLFRNANVIFHSSLIESITGSAFSPNGKVAYYSTADANSYLIQLDLTAANVWASRDTIAALSHPFEAGGRLRLAPDNKIYWSCAWTNGINFNYPYQDTMYHTENMNLSVINDPDVVGTGCNFSLYSFNLGGKRCYWGLPNNPDYDMGPLVGSNCDTLFSGVNEIKEHQSFELYPNPTNNRFIIALHSTINSGGLVVISDQLGKQVKVIKLDLNSITQEVNTSEIEPGIYFVSVRCAGRILDTKKVVIIR